MINNILLMSFGAGLLCQLLILITYSFRNIMFQVKKRKVGNLNVIPSKLWFLKRKWIFLKTYPQIFLRIRWMSWISLMNMILISLQVSSLKDNLTSNKLYKDMIIFKMKTLTQTTFWWISLSKTWARIINWVVKKIQLMGFLNSILLTHSIIEVFSTKEFKVN